MMQEIINGTEEHFLKERFKFEWVSASEGEKFQKTMEEFEKTVSKLGPLNLE